MPAFEGLLPLGDNETALDLLFELANWHALAKLRLHTEVTIAIFRAATTEVTAAIRYFANTTCERYETHELAKEVDARVRREEKIVNGPPPNRERKVVHYNTPHTYKFHGMPDYPDSIEEIGTTDNVNSQVVCILLGPDECRPSLILILPGRTRTSPRQAILCSYEQDPVCHANRQASATCGVAARPSRRRRLHASPPAPPPEATSSQTVTFGREPGRDGGT